MPMARQHHDVGAVGAGRQNSGEADAAGAHHEHGLVAAQVHLVETVDGTRQRFRQRAQFRIDAGRRLVGGVGRDVGEFAHAAVDAFPHQTPLVAHVVVARGAERTQPAAQQRFDAHQVAFLHMLHASAGGGNRAGQFVARRDASAGRKLPAIEVQIRAADADAADGQLHLAGSGRRHCLLAHREFASIVPARRLRRGHRRLACCFATTESSPTCSGLDGQPWNTQRRW